jgi:hypothetical protein
VAIVVTERFLWFTSVAPGRQQDNISDYDKTYVLVLYSDIILPFDATDVKD